MNESTKWTIFGGAIVGLAGIFVANVVGKQGYKNGVLDFAKIFKGYDPEGYEDFKDNVRTPFPLD